jgi:hypothetical protein
VGTTGSGSLFGDIYDNISIPVTIDGGVLAKQLKIVRLRGIDLQRCPQPHVPSISTSKCDDIAGIIPPGQGGLFGGDIEGDETRVSLH